MALSRSEGWVLTDSEAMMCGDAVITIDICGHRKIAKHHKTALAVIVKNINALAGSDL